MTPSLLAVCLIVAFAAVKAEWEDIILPPLDGKQDPEVTLYFAQGADLTTSQYTSIMTTLQTVLPFKLWVGIPQCAQNVCSIPKTLSKGIDRIEQSMLDAGMNSVKTFYGGHSLGGAMMP